MSQRSRDRKPNMADDAPKPPSGKNGKGDISPWVAKIIAESEDAIRRAEEALKQFKAIEAARKAKLSKTKNG